MLCRDSGPKFTFGVIVGNVDVCVREVGVNAGGQLRRNAWIESLSMSSAGSVHAITDLEMS